MCSLEGLSLKCDASSLPNISSQTIRIRLTAAATTAALPSNNDIRNKDELINLDRASVCAKCSIFEDFSTTKTKEKKNNFFYNLLQCNRVDIYGLFEAESRCILG